jgi:hypothetical protein
MAKIIQHFDIRINEYRALVEWYWQEKSAVLREICPSANFFTKSKSAELEFKPIFSPNPHLIQSGQQGWEAGDQQP